MKQFLCLFFFIISIQLYSQPRYLQGLIVTQTNDTITCLVPAASSFGDRITIKKSEGGEVENIPLNKIKYLATTFNVFENITYNKRDKAVNKLMWLKLEGRINLYLETVVNTGSSRSFGGGRLNSFDPPTKTYAIRKSDTTFFIEEDNFVEIITPLIFENKELLHKVSNKIYKYEDIETLVKQYNGLPEPEKDFTKINSPVPSQLFTDKAFRKIVEAECDGKIFTKVETIPSIKGGEGALTDSLSVYFNNSNIHIKGKATFVFLLTKNSNVLDIEKISGEISKEKDFKKGLLAYSKMWIPALQNSRNVCAIVQLETDFQKDQITLKLVTKN